MSYKCYCAIRNVHVLPSFSIVQDLKPIRLNERPQQSVTVIVTE